jgi:MFS family permease
MAPQSSAAPALAPAGAGAPGPVLPGDAAPAAVSRADLQGDRATLALSGLHGVATAFTTFNLPVYLSAELHFDAVQIGAFLAAFFFTPIVAAFPIGLSSDRVRPRALLLAALGFLALAALGLATQTSFGAVLASFVALGLSQNMVKQVLDALWFRRRRGEGAVGSHFGPFVLVRFAGVGVGMAAGGFLLDSLGFRTALTSLAVVAVGLAALVRLLPDTPVHQTRARDYGRDMWRRDVLVFALWLFLFATHWGAEAVCYGRFLREDLRLDLDWMGLYMAGELVTLASAGFLAGRPSVVARLGDARLLAAGLLLSGLAQVAMVTSDPLVSFLFRALHGVGDGVVGILVYSAVGRLFQVERIGGNAGLVLLIATVGAAAGALAYGAVGAAWGNGVPLVVGGLSVVALVPLAFVRSRTRPRPTPSLASGA